MVWIEFDTRLRDHWKINRLKDDLKIEYISALGLISCLWTWAAENAENGDLSKFKKVEISQAARWSGDENALNRALIACNFINESGKIHDWHKHGIRFLLSQRKRARKYRKSSRDGNITKDVTVTSFLPYRTIPINIIKNNINNKNNLKMPGIPEDLIDNSNEINAWLSYKREKGQTYKPRGLNALWSALRKIPAFQRKAAIDTSMANNWAGLFAPKQSQGGSSDGKNASRVGRTGGFVPTKQPIA